MLITNMLEALGGGEAGPPLSGHTKTRLCALAGGRPGGLPISALTLRCGDPKGVASGVLKTVPRAWQSRDLGSDLGSVT